MSTIGIIARHEVGGRWTGRYVGYDGYPTGLGRTLFEAYAHHFQRDLVAMLHTLIDEHPCGWATLVDVDFARLPATLHNETLVAPFSHHTLPEAIPQCYCHDEQGRRVYSWHDETLPSDELLVASDDPSSWVGARYVYLFNEDTHSMTILTYIGGYSSSSYWRRIATIGLSFYQGDEQPDWLAVERRAR